MRKINLAIIGCGAVAEFFHLPSLRRIPEVTVSCVVDVNPNRAEKIKKDFNLTKAKTYTNYVDALKEDIDAVLVLTPPKTHASICTSALRMGKHVFCEKPLSSNLEDAKQIVQAANSSNSVFMIGYHYRFSNVFKKAKELIDAYNFDISQVKGHFLTDIRKYPAVTAFRFQKEDGGVIHDQGSHIIDLLRWYLGEINCVSATTSQVLELPVEDTASLSLEFENEHALNKITGDISLSWSSDFKLELEFSGKTGRLIASYGLNLITLNLIGRSIFKRGHLHLIVKNLKSPYEVELNHFMKSAINNEKTRPDAIDGLNTLAVVKAAYESAHKKQEILTRVWSD